MIEFDVLPGARAGRRALRRARPRRARPRAARSTLTAALEHFATRAVRRRPPPARHQARAAASARCSRRSTRPARASARSSAPALRGVLARFRALAPDIGARLDGAGHPGRRRRRRSCADASTGARLPERAAARIARGRDQRARAALEPRHARRSSTRSRGAGGEIYVWTVDDAARDRAPRRARRDRRDHQRPAPLRRDRADRRAVAGRVGAGARGVAGASSSAPSLATTRPCRRHSKVTTPRSR